MGDLDWKTYIATLTKVTLFTVCIVEIMIFALWQLKALGLLK